VSAARAAAVDTGVLVCGEEGSGRQVVARTVHVLQRGSAARFIVVNCADLEGADLERSIFGSAHGGRGSAKRQARSRDLERVGRKGSLYEARGGTLYLKDLAAASARVQARLARIMRDREAVLGETGETIELDVRPIAAAGADFERAVGDGLVRGDLAKRLSGIRIDVPALRDRREDIAPLANRFLRDICRNQGLPPRALSRSALAVMAALPWHGNGAELRALLENIVLASKGGRHVGLDDVLANVRLDGAALAVPRHGTLKQAREAFERDYISAVVERSHGRIAEAARALGIQRTNLYRKIRVLRIKHERPS
jgi:DNA-binding NtrC family response regulator